MEKRYRLGDRELFRTSAYGRYLLDPTRHLLCKQCPHRVNVQIEAQHLLS